jgi:glycosyltransferase involved in cell wall biosynthesis
MTARVLVYFPHNPWPPRTGAHRRCIQILDGLLQIGARVHLASAQQFSDQPWTKEAISSLRARGLEKVWIYQPFRGQARLERFEARLRGCDDWHFCSWWLRRWFRSLMERIRPTSVVITYTLADGLLDHARFANVHRVLEMQDLVSVNAEMRLGIDQRIKQFVQTGQPGELFDTDLLWADKFIPTNEELAIYDRYDTVIAIARREQLLVQKNLCRAHVKWVPMHISAVQIANTYDAPPIFLASGNKFNQVGLLLLLNEVLARVRVECPDFQVDVAGDLSQFAIPWSNVRYMGYVPNLEDVCRSAAFAICPVFAGTGQQIKLIEAMAHGLAVVAFRRAAAESLLRHGETGLIATNTDEFAVHLISLWRNRGLCRQLGSAARVLMECTGNTATALRTIFPDPTCIASGGERQGPRKEKVR